MRWTILVAVALIVASLGAVIVAACSGPTCKPGQLVLDVELLQTAPLADTITVSGSDSGAEVMQSFPHTPTNAPAGVEHTTVILTFPGGYPADKVVHLVIKALGGVTLLGANTATIHLDASCTSGSVLVFGGPIPTDDMGSVD